MSSGEIAAAIKDNLANTDYGDLLAARGIATVALDASGRIIEYQPDGTVTTLAADKQ